MLHLFTPPCVFPAKQQCIIRLTLCCMHQRSGDTVWCVRRITGSDTLIAFLIDSRLLSFSSKNRFRIARPGIPTGLSTITISSSLHADRSVYTPRRHHIPRLSQTGSHLYAVGSQFHCMKHIFSGKDPPATTTGISFHTCPHIFFTSARIPDLLIIGYRGKFLQLLSENPRCPPAFYPSITTRSGIRW